MIEFWIADLKSEEAAISIPACTGSWEFRRRDDYAAVLSKIEEGQCAATYYAYNESVTHRTADQDFAAVTGELIDICLILSFFTATCVTPKGSTPQSDAAFIELGDSFVRPRAIAGFSALQINTTYSDFFSGGIARLAGHFQSRRLRLFLSCAGPDFSGHEFGVKSCLKKELCNAE